VDRRHNRVKPHLKQLQQDTDHLGEALLQVDLIGAGGWVAVIWRDFQAIVGSWHNAESDTKETDPEPAQPPASG
jgi:hypothetical protein